MIYLFLASTLLSVILTQIYYYFQLKKLEKKVDNALEMKVDQVFDTLKREIPMGATFITGSLEEKLKGKALLEVKKLVPDVKGDEVPFKLILYPILIALIVGVTLYQIV